MIMDFLDLLKKNEKTIKSKFGVRKIGIFGSASRDAMKKESDVDVLVEFEMGKKNFDNFMDLSFFLEDLFGKKIDLVTKEALRPEMKTSILEEVSYA